MTAAELIAFEQDIAECFERGEIKGPIHLSGGNEKALIRIFKNVQREDWVFSTWRNHLHALLHGVAPEKLKAHILNGPSMNINFPEHRFVTSAIVGGIAPIACGVAAGIKLAGGKEKVWCFVRDMAASIGIFYEARKYAAKQDLPITFVIENNGLSTNTPTTKTWGGNKKEEKVHIYSYTRRWPHVGVGKWVTI